MRKPRVSVRQSERGRQAVAALGKRGSKKRRPERREKGSVPKPPQSGALPESRNGRGAPVEVGARTAPAGGRLAAVESATTTSRGKYVYCIIEASDPLRFGPIGIGANPSDVYTVHFKELAAVVSDAPLEVLDSTREHVLAHERVNETVMREHTVIPAPSSKRARTSSSSCGRRPMPSATC